MNYYNFKDLGPKMKSNDDIESDTLDEKDNRTEYYTDIIVYYIFGILLLVTILFLYQLL